MLLIKINTLRSETKWVLGNKSPLSLGGGGDPSGVQREAVTLPFQAVGHNELSPLFGTCPFLCLHSWGSRLLELPNLEVATEQTLTVRGCPTVNSLRGSGPGYITGTLIHPSNGLLRFLCWARDEALGPAQPHSLKQWYPHTGLMLRGHSPLAPSFACSFHLSHPLTAVAGPGIALHDSPGRQRLHFLCICPDTQHTVGVIKGGQAVLVQRQREWAKWKQREVEERGRRNFCSSSFLSPFWELFSWVRAGECHRGVTDDVLSSRLGIWPGQSDVFTRCCRWVVRLKVTVHFIQNLFLYLFINIVLLLKEVLNKNIIHPQSSKHNWFCFCLIFLMGFIFSVLFWDWTEGSKFLSKSTGILAASVCLYVIIFCLFQPESSLRVGI